MNSGEITQEYDQHLGPVNTITFVDENRRFVTTSDDKTIRAWDRIFGQVPSCGREASVGDERMDIVSKRSLRTARSDVSL